MRNHLWRVDVYLDRQQVRSAEVPFLGEALRLWWRYWRRSVAETATLSYLRL